MEKDNQVWYKYNFGQGKDCKRKFYGECVREVSIMWRNKWKWHISVTSSNLYHPLIKSTCFQNKNIHKLTWKVPGGRIKQIYHILIFARHSSNTTDVKACSGCNCDTKCYLVKAVLRHKLKNAQECDRVQRKNAIPRNWRTQKSTLSMRTTSVASWKVLKR
jgi:hypothetical protein